MVHFNKIHSQAVEKVIWSDETKITFYPCLILLILLNTISTVMDGGGSIMLWKYYYSAETVNLVRISGKMDEANYGNW